MSAAAAACDQIQEINESLIDLENPLEPWTPQGESVRDNEFLAHDSIYLLLDENENAKV